VSAVELTNKPSLELKSPWRFLMPLEGAEGLDRELIELTRKDELLIITDMIATSKVSLLYAFSGNGKSSLINAGVIPQFKRRGYAVFKTRPRPPWAINDPSFAFKECVLRSLELPLLSQPDLQKLRMISDQLGSAADSSSAELVGVLRGLEARLTRLQLSSPVNEITAYLRSKLDVPLSKFISEVQVLVGPESRLLFLCDQFEELFVHYQGTHQLDDLIAEFGKIWADRALHINFLFSMREDWVGSMIAFREAMPDVFSNYYKLDPLRRSKAETVLNLPLERLGLAWGVGVTNRILDDLARAYSRNQADRFNGINLTPSPQDNHFIELPALQVVAEEIWRTKVSTDSPFSMEHYDALAKGTATEQVDSPAQRVLDRYLSEQLTELAGSDSKGKRLHEARIDGLYCLTDRVRHRRAIAEGILVEEIGALRPKDLNLSPVTKEDVSLAFQPLAERRLIHRDQTVDSQVQFELAHDFAVRSVVSLWRDLDQKRIAEVALLQRDREKRKSLLADLEIREKRVLKLVWLATIVGALGLSAMTAFSFVSDDFPWSWRELFSGMNASLALLFGLAAGAALLNRRWMSTALGILGVGIALTLNAFVLPSPSSLRSISMHFPVRLRGNFYDRSNLKSFLGVFFPDTTVIRCPGNYFGELGLFLPNGENRPFCESWSFNPQPSKVEAGFYWISMKSSYTHDVLLDGVSDNGSRPFAVAVAPGDLFLGNMPGPSWQASLLAALGVVIFFTLVVKEQIALRLAWGGSERTDLTLRVIAAEWVDIISSVAAFGFVVFIEISTFPFIRSPMRAGAISERSLMSYTLLATAVALVTFSQILIVGKFGKTLGVWWAGSEIIDSEGGRPSRRRIMRRQLGFSLWAALNLFFFLPWLVLTPLFAWKARGRNFYDAFAGTAIRPVTTQEAKVSESKTKKVFGESFRDHPSERG